MSPHVKKKGKVTSPRFPHAKRKKRKGKGDVARFPCAKKRRGKGDVARFPYTKKKKKGITSLDFFCWGRRNRFSPLRRRARSPSFRFSSPSSFFFVTDQFRNGNSCNRCYCLVADGPCTGLQTDRYVPPIPGGIIRN